MYNMYCTAIFDYGIDCNEQDKFYYYEPLNHLCQQLDTIGPADANRNHAGTCIMICFKCF